MDALYHRTKSMLDELNRHFMALEKCAPEEAPMIENEIQNRLHHIDENCKQLDILTNKELPQRRLAARVQVEQLRYDCRHYDASLRNFIQRRLTREREIREREELLSKRFTAIDSDTSIMIDHSLVQNRSLHNVHRNVDEMIGTGSSVLENLREQKSTLKGARKRILDIANTLGLSNTVMRLIEKRTYQDKIILFVGMAVTCLLMFLIYKYLA